MEPSADHPWLAAPPACATFPAPVGPPVSEFGIKSNELLTRLSNTQDLHRTVKIIYVLVDVIHN